MTLWKTTLEPTQFLLNRARLRPKWLPQKSWMSLQDCQIVTDKQLTQYHRKMEDAPTLQKIPESECSDVWIRLPPHKWRNPWQTWKIPWYLSNEICMASAYQDFYGKDNSRKFCWNFDWKKYQIGNVFFVHRKQRLMFSVYVDDIKNGWNEAEYGSHVEDIDEAMLLLTKPTSFLDHAYLGCTQRECKPNAMIIEECTQMFESRISAGATEKLPGWDKFHAKTVAWSCDMEGHARKCVERYCELANKKVEQIKKVQVLAWMIIYSDRKNLNQLENHQQNCSQIVLKCVYSARIGRPDILWSVNKLARAAAKWTACDRRLARLVSYIHHTSDCRQYCHVGNTAQQCRLGLFQDSDFAGDLEDSKTISGWVLCISGSRTFVSISWMCKKQTSVSHSSTASDNVGRWTANGRFSCSRFMGCGDWSIAINKQNQITNQFRSIWERMRDR